MSLKTDGIVVPTEPPQSYERPQPLLGGFSRLDVTPPLDSMKVFGLGYWFARSVRFNGVRDPLYARALVLGDGGACQVIVSVDAINDTYGFIPQSQMKISQLLGIPPSQIFISCTHTHSAPLVEFNRTDEGIEYGAFLVSRIVAGVMQAYQRRAPLSATLSDRRLTNVVRNRRPILQNGQIAELHAPIDPAEIADPGPLNDTLTLVKFHRESGTVAGSICHFGIHGVAIQCSELISSDCMGRAIQLFESDTAGETVMLHLNAPCADIDPVVMGGEEALDEMTRRLYAGLRDVNASPERPINLTPQLSTSSLYRAKRRTTRATEDLLHQEARLAAPAGGQDLHHHSGPGYERFLLEEEQAVAKMPAAFDIPYQIFRTGDLLWIGVGGEIFTRFGQFLASLDNRFEVLPVGITGASVGYLPGLEMFDQGGYEVAAARWCSIAPGESEKLFQKLESDVRVVAGAAIQ